MAKLDVFASAQDEQAVRDEVARLKKIVDALMNRAERSTSARGSDFSLFQTAVMLEDRVRSRTEDLEAALRENEKINRALQHATAQMELEIQERKRAEAFREGQNRVLEMIALDAPLDQSLDVLLRCVEAQYGGMLCSVMLLGEDGQRTDACIAPSLPQAYIDSLKGFCIGPSAGSCGTAMHRREQVIVTDILEDPLWDDYRSLAVPHGLRACWSRPIYSGAGKVLGAFAIYYREVRGPDTLEQKLIELAARIAGIAIERKLDEAYIRHMAHHDALTGLPNRILLEDRLRQAITQASRHKTLVAVLFIDLDHFKHINDSLGHHVGDSLLQAVAKRMQECLREGDSIARLGGDEFVISLTDIHHNRDAAGVAQKIQAALAQQRLAASNQLRQALARAEFVLHYQPQVSLRSGAIVGVEALLRWQHPQLGLVPPIQFISILEENGLMGEVGKWVLRTACAQAVAWLAMGLPPVRIAVNLSARQFSGADIVQTVAEVLEETGFCPEWLELEITESLILDNSERVIHAMHELKRMGVSLSLDDFGTGYSSLSYLRRFPVGRLKIDRSFVHDVTSNTGGADIVRSILALSHKLGLGAIAEGVETEAQLGYLLKQGCLEIQGFLFSPALPVEEMTELLRSDRRLPLFSHIPLAGHTLLVVDDDEDIGVALKRILRKEGLHVLSAINVDEAYELLARNSVGVIIADLNISGKSGIDFLNRTKSLHADAIRILLTGEAEIVAVVNAINRGAIYKILVKPWDNHVLIENIREAFSLYAALQENSVHE